jgi:hypothetical protein
MSETRTTPASLQSRFVGRMFVHPAFDYLLIGGGLSLVVAALVYFNAGLTLALSAGWLPAFILLSNSAHFASSSVRLYTKPDHFRHFPFLTMLLPAIAIVVASLAMIWPAELGRHLQALYLTWSPFHYAAQAYGLALMYCYRSECQLSLWEKRLLWLVCMLPFFRSFLGAADSGLRWFVSPDFILQHRSLVWLLDTVTKSLLLLTFAIPVGYFLRLQANKTSPMPLISLVIVLTNGVWWIALDYLDAFVWATVFHGVQYLAIVIIFHVKDQLRRPDNRRGPLYHACWFYGVSLLLGYGLFYCWPQFYVLLGFGLAESMLLVIAVINIHHFIVDAYIWRLRKDKNFETVVAGPGATVPQSAA